MEKIICSLEDWDSILNFYRPNGSSKTWYIKELKKLTRPLMWGDWDIFTEDGEMFSQEFFKGKVCPPIYNKNIEYLPQDKILDSKHIYIINIYNMSFFRDNYYIGFKCVSEKYLNDVRSGKSKILLMLILEGYSGSEGNNDLEIIEKWRIDSDLPKHSIYYATGNQLLTNDYQGIKIQPILDFESWNNVKYEKTIEFNPTDEKNLFLMYNRNPRPHRIEFCIGLLKYDIFYRGLLSLGDMSIYNPNTYIVEEDSVVEFNFLKNNSPFVINSKTSLYYNLACEITLSDYEKTFISIISETLMTKNTLFISEKTWKPIMVGHPFIILGNKHTLKFLKSLGYKTFDKWINEEYDNIDDENERNVAVLNEIRKFSHLNVQDLKKIRNEMKEVCDYNQKNFYRLYNEKYGTDNINSQISSLISEIWKELI